MLIALLVNQRVDAALADRCDQHCCPNCGGIVTLKRGKKVVAHFAHKPPFNCTWGAGETRAHLDAKRLIADSYQSRGIKSALEFVVETLTGDRRADIMIWGPKSNAMIAFELQHSSIDIRELEKRSFSYASANIAQIWIPFIRPTIWKKGKPKRGYDWFVEEYAAPQFERWIHGLNGTDGMWMFDPLDRLLWHARLAKHEIYVEETRWFSEGGEENYGGGYHRTSKRFRELSLNGPHHIDDLKIELKSRDEFSTSSYQWPKGPVAKFVHS